MAYLVLQNGRVFEGKRIGAAGEKLGELVFTTGMEGYLETLTDPSYYGQIVTQTFPLIGNYGVNSEDYESDRSSVRARSALVSSFCAIVFILASFFRAVSGVYGARWNESRTA